MRRKSWSYLLEVIIFVLVSTMKNVSGTSYEFCIKDFISLGRHAWRCKGRITTTTAIIETNNQSIFPNTSLATQNNNNDLITQAENTFDPHGNENKEHKFRCYRGREFNTLRGLNTHRRSCIVKETPDMKELFKDTTEEIDVTQNGDDEITDIITDMPKIFIKKGVILPNSERDWERTNQFFRSNLHHNNEILNIDNEINLMQSSIYNDFSEQHGVVNDGKKSYDTDYNVMTKNKLKRQSAVLKSRILNPEEEIKHVSRILRKNFRKKRISENYDHQSDYYKYFWKYCEKASEPKEERVKPLFTENDCEKCFKNILSDKNRQKRFTSLLWMNTFKDPIINFNLEPPTYTEISKIISKMKSSASSCPLDQISVIASKKCPILRSHLTKII